MFYERRPVGDELFHADKQIDKNEDDNNRFSKLCERAQKAKNVRPAQQIFLTDTQQLLTPPGHHQPKFKAAVSSCWLKAATRSCRISITKIYCIYHCTRLILNSIRLAQYTRHAATSPTQHNEVNH